MLYEKMLNEKKMSGSGSVTIPAYLRRDLGLEGGEKLEILVDDAGDIKLHRIEGTCMLCGSHEALLKVEKKYICRVCAGKIGEELRAVLEKKEA